MKFIKNIVNILINLYVLAKVMIFSYCIYAFLPGLSWPFKLEHYEHPLSK